MCQWGANGNPWADYRMDPSPTPTYPKPRGCNSSTTDLSTSCAVVGGLITIVVMTLVFVRRDACKAFLHIEIGFDLFVRSFHTKSAPQIFQNSLTQNHQILQGPVYGHVYSNTRYYVIIPFLSEVIAKQKTVKKMPPPMTLGGIS